MRISIALLGLAALASAAAAQVPPPTGTAAEIAAIEQAWGEAFLNRDKAYLEKLVAPEFKLMNSDEGGVEFTPRDRWMANFDGFEFHEFEVKTVDVVAAGDTAVATATGRWKISRVGLPGTRDRGFIVTDTFVRRNGAWQVVFRHADSPAPATAPAPATPSAPSERGR